jgi:CheY-like chemotaxis protein
MSSSTAKQIKPEKPRILLVEDELVMQKLHCALLEQIGYHVEIASNGAEALEKAKQEYSLIFMDINLPDMNGAYITQVIRSTEHRNKHVPIVVLTTEQEEKKLTACLDAGADCIYMKPISEENLAEIIITYDSASLMN